MNEYRSLSLKYFYLAWAEIFARDSSVYFFIHLFLDNLCLLNSNLSANILYLVTFTFKLAKHKMTNKMLRKPGPSLVFYPRPTEE